MTTWETVLTFWFEELKPEQWWYRNPDVDEAIRRRFSETLARGARGELFGWRTSVNGRLAEIIVLDQFSRNLHRGMRDAFAQDGVALVLAQEAVGRGLDHDLPAQRLTFLYMPFMHSESKEIHRVSVDLHSRPGLERRLTWELKHKAIIDRFGRYPHRNAALDRLSTDEEISFLQEPGSSF